MKVFAHRVNAIEDLRNVPKNMGVEIDIRPYKGELILNHDPFVEGDRLSDYLKEYDHNGIILNIKSEGIEPHILSLLEKNKINDYFFLDSSFPVCSRFIKDEMKDFAVRFSEWEPEGLAINLAGLANWIWIDTFTKIPIDQKTADRFRMLGYKLCFVSPDLTGKADQILAYIEELNSNGIKLDAVCCKLNNSHSWQNYDY